MKPLLATSLIAVALFISPLTVGATTHEELLAEIKELREVVRNLRLELQNQVFEENKDFRFDRNLYIGSRGEDVEKLQAFLANNTQFYPEGLTTGYYGVLTNNAVDRLKREYEITETGFGEESREALNELFQRRSAFVVSTSGFALEPGDTQDENEGDEDERGDDEEELDVRELARDIHVRVNQVRTREGFNALGWDGELAQVALAHSQSQAEDNEEVTDPELLCQYPIIRHEGFESGFSVRDRVINAGVPFRSVGENIAMIPIIQTRTYSFDFDEETPVCPTRGEFTVQSAADRAEYESYLDELLEKAEAVESVDFLRIDRYSHEEIVDLAVEGWMESPGHRENILFPDYTHAGIGISRVNEYLIITQNFIGR